MNWIPFDPTDGKTFPAIGDHLVSTTGGDVMIDTWDGQDWLLNPTDIVVAYMDLPEPFPVDQVEEGGENG